MATREGGPPPHHAGAMPAHPTPRQRNGVPMMPAPSPLPTAVSFQGQTLARVGDDTSFLLLAPAHGGRLVRWVHRGEDILYWPDAADWTRPGKIRGGNPLLFPFIGRHFADGEAGRWRDAAGSVHALPQHGFARDLPFAVDAAEDGEGGPSIAMSLHASDETRAGYPFDFAFTAGYRLLPDGLEATLRIRNTGTAPLPHYAGHHFYFALPASVRAGAKLAMPPAARQRQRPDGTLVPAEPGAACYRLDDARLQDTFHVLRPADGHAGTAVLAIPPHAAAPRGRRLAIELDAGGSAAWHAVTTWSEHDQADYYCVEPWLGLPDAIGHGNGLRWLAPGDEDYAVCRLKVQA